MQVNDIVILRDKLLDKISEAFRNKKIIRGFPVAIKVEELPAVYIYLQDIKFGSLAFNVYGITVRYFIDFIYEAVSDLDYLRRGKDIENEILQDCLSMLKLLYEYEEELSNETYAGVISETSAELLLEREGLYRIMRYSVEFKINTQKEGR